MPSHKMRSNKGLTAAAIVLCLVCGLSFTQSSAVPSPIEDSQIPDIFVAENADASSSFPMSKIWDAWEIKSRIFS